ncbi:MAG: hypothetical protein HUJ66_02420 [Oscillospiraceae bacterium]|nr:hypothetical protein [Oscillospiraceae bacterium]
MRRSWLYALFLRLLSLFSEKSGKSEAADVGGAGKYFSVMTEELFGALRDKDGTQNSDSRPDAESPAELEASPLTELINSRRDSDKEDMHSSPAGEKRSLFSESDRGEALSESSGGNGGAYSEQSPEGGLLSRRSGDKLGSENRQSRISAGLDSVVSEESVPEHVVFSDIGVATRIFDWRRILRPMGSFDVDWSYRNAVIEDGILRPCLEQIPVAVTEILLDTSGSIDEPLLKRFLQECRNILPYSRVRVGCFDTVFYGFTDINSIRDLEEMVFEGRHGTSFSAAVNAFSGRADNRIIFTDGDAPMPAQRMDIIWIVFGGKRIKPRGGRVFYVDGDFLK